MDIEALDPRDGALSHKVKSLNKKRVFFLFFFSWIIINEKDELFKNQESLRVILSLLVLVSEIFFLQQTIDTNNNNRTLIIFLQKHLYFLWINVKQVLNLVVEYWPKSLQFLEFHLDLIRL